VRRRGAGPATETRRDAAVSMLDYTMDDARRDHMARMEAKMFAPGAFVMLHHACKAAGKPHPDAGRIGRIVSRNGDNMVTEFWNDDLIGGATFSVIPRGHWAPARRPLDCRVR